MKNMLMRPTSALFPAVLLAAGLYSPDTVPEELFLYWCMIQLYSLCSIDSFRNAAAREPGVRRVDRRFSGTWPMILLGIILACAANSAKSRGLILPILLAAAGCVIIEQLFEERMFALSRRTDGVVLSIISNALLLVGLLLDGSGGVSASVQGFYTTCASALGAAIAIAANYFIEPMHACSLVPRNIPFAPKAMAQCLLYPAPPFMFVIVLGVEYAMAGMILWRLSRTVCRRSQDESRPLNLLLVTAAGSVIVAGVYGLNIVYPITVCVSLVCAAIVYCAPSWRFYTGVVLNLMALRMLGSGIELGQMMIKDVIIIAACAIAVILNLHKAFLRKV